MSWLDSLTIDDVVIPAWRSIKGLAGSPPPKQDVRDRARRHGSRDRTEFYQSRILEVDDAVLKGDPGTIWASLDELKAAYALGTEHVVRFRRSGQDFDERVTGRVAGELTADLGYESQGLILWSVPLLAADPRIYADTLSEASYIPVDGGAGGLSFPLSFPLEFSSSPDADLLVVANEGTFPTPPVWTITGPAVNPQIVNETTGDTITTTGLNLLEGDELIIDVAERTVTIDGTERPDLIDSSQTTWGELAVGVNVIRLLGGGFVTEDIEATTNLVPNGGFEVDTSGWLARGGATIADDATKALFGSNSLRVDLLAANDGVQIAGAGPLVNSSSVYTASAYVWAPSGKTITLSFTAGKNGTFETTMVAKNIVGNGAWQRIVCTAITPSDATSVGITIWDTHEGAFSFYVDGAQIEAKDHATDYVDTNGSTASRSAQTATRLSVAYRDARI